MEIDPITKEIIDENNLIKIQSYSFDVNSLYEWFKYSDNWINPVTNFRFTTMEVLQYLKKIIEIKKIPDVLNNDKYQNIYLTSSVARFFNYYTYLTFVREYEKNCKILNNLKNTINKLNEKNKENDKMINLFDQKINKIISENNFDKIMIENINSSIIREDISEKNKKKLKMLHNFMKKREIKINKKSKNIVKLNETIEVKEYYENLI